VSRNPSRRARANTSLNFSGGLPRSSESRPTPTIRSAYASDDQHPPRPHPPWPARLRRGAARMEALRPGAAHRRDRRGHRRRRPCSRAPRSTRSTRSSGFNSSKTRPGGGETGDALRASCGTVCSCAEASSASATRRSTAPELRLGPNWPHYRPLEWGSERSQKGRSSARRNTDAPTPTVVDAAAAESLHSVEAIGVRRSRSRPTSAT
jgi:hypothetical protein